MTFDRFLETIVEECDDGNVIDWDCVVEALHAKLAEAAAELSMAGYEFVERDENCSWKSSSKTSEEFPSRALAVASAYDDYKGDHANHQN